ncbi:hypothetical protein GCM10010840_12800 [Deinococcus aerolatus]|uniref:DinB-like domain-containing protein n=1 Tax=Deinococcus aerolatus TaxID=522487 RepID=A0ABQ2G579_9DEIO|nr:hypothetical protein [Deinococcus aerolatus]GGL76151.1 hypothetical protein GCM10010840_12800 [Deinococcus aerolatus]
MSTPELLREMLREVLYGPDGGPLAVGLFSVGEAGLLRTVHALTPAQASAPAAPGRPTPAQVTVHLRQSLDLAAAQLADPYALLPDEADAWSVRPATPQAWRLELVALARAGQNLYDALYLPLSPEGLRIAFGAVTHAAYHTGALRFHLASLTAGPP